MRIRWSPTANTSNRSRESLCLAAAAHQKTSLLQSVFRQSASALSSWSERFARKHSVSVTNRHLQRVTTALPCRFDLHRIDSDLRLKHRPHSRATSTWATLPIHRSRCLLQRGGYQTAAPMDFPRLVTCNELVVRSPGSLRASANGIPFGNPQGGDRVTALAVDRISSVGRFRPAEHGSTGLPPCAFGSLAHLLSQQDALAA